MMNSVWLAEYTSYWRGRGAKGAKHPQSGLEKTYPNVVGLDFGSFAILLTWDPHEGGVFYYFEDDQPVSRSLNGNYAEFSRSLDFELSLYRRCATPDEMLTVQLRLTTDVVENVRATFRNWRKIPFETLFATIEEIVPRHLLPKHYREPVA